MKKWITSLLAIVCAMSNSIQAIASDIEEKQETKIVLLSDIEWEPLNPARGDSSPKAGTLWGNRAGAEATGFLAKFVDGFSSPPHIHNVTYRAVVISGEIHNDDPNAEKMWMSRGSFWTQPKGEAHITAARGEENIALVEIDEGPYLVQHTHDAFDSGERAVNIDASNIVWVTPPGLNPSKTGPKVAYLWGILEAGLDNGTFIKLPAGFVGYIHSTGSIFRVVTIEGQPVYLEDEEIKLAPGSYFSSSGDSMHSIRSGPDQDSIFYVRTNGPYRIIPASSQE
ncbi:DUF4437 domain-containing protein [Rubellicoccus peritrichatus]|uniref:DUF4437 domain-containing protein n=1 Tax=Rubellicoccus peritrichatus TaxID=3080537 RepID=A0AAQ3L5Y8_9BACT|nr:DUF4437 domain-containing protein [Puniceicoccus sp. CR14]WOO39671.1 DUF4437 domain-containing protein [Puniceicoccus sp. CR14]